MVGGGQRGQAASPEWPPQAWAPVLGVVPPGGPGPLGVSWGRKWLAAPWPGRKCGAQGFAGTRVPRCSSVRSRRGPTVTSRAHCGDFMGSSQGHHRDIKGTSRHVTGTRRAAGCWAAGRVFVSPHRELLLHLPPSCGGLCFRGPRTAAPAAPVWPRDTGQSQDSVPAPAVLWRQPQDLARKPLRTRLCPVTLQGPGRNLAGGRGSGPADPRTGPRWEQHREHTAQGPAEPDEAPVGPDGNARCVPAFAVGSWSLGKCKTRPRGSRWREEGRGSSWRHGFKAGAGASHAQKVPRAAPLPVREVGARAVLTLGPDRGGFLVTLREGLGSAWRLR